MSRISFSFLITTYNQEKFIKEALESALNQDYQDIEIIVCDDVSHDGTVSIAQQIADSYHGPIRIVIHRNDVNLKPAANFHQAALLARNEWLVMASGDDISMPQRASKLAEAIQKHPEALAFTSNFEYIDGNGCTNGLSNPTDVYLHGAAFCWHRSVILDFPPPPPDIILEDIGFYPRIFMLGGTCVLLPDVLVRYRLHDTNISGTGGQTAFSVRKTQHRFANIIRRCTENQLNELEYLSKTHTISRKEDIQKYLKLVLEENASDDKVYSEAVDVMGSSVLRQLKYIFIPGAHVAITSMTARLKCVLQSWKTG